MKHTPYGRAFVFRNTAIKRCKRRLQRCRSKPQLRGKCQASGVPPITPLPFAWATVAVDDIDTIAADAGLRVAETWTEAGRWFAHLTP